MPSSIFAIVSLELPYLIILQVKGLLILRLQYLCIAFHIGHVQDLTADCMNKVCSLVASGLGKEFRKTCDKGNNIVGLDDRRFETGLAAWHTDELVATDAPAFIVQTDVGRIAESNALVESVTGIVQDVLHVQTVEV